MQEISIYPVNPVVRISDELPLTCKSNWNITSCQLLHNNESYPMLTNYSDNNSSPRCIFYISELTREEHHGQWTCVIDGDNGTFTVSTNLTLIRKIFSIHFYSLSNIKKILIIFYVFQR